MKQLLKYFDVIWNFLGIFLERQFKLESFVFWTLKIKKTLIEKQI